jgi:hypothetical protein
LTSPPMAKLIANGSGFLQRVGTRQHPAEL